MKTICDHQGFRVSTTWAWIARRSWIALSFVTVIATQSTAWASVTSCDPIYNPSTSYPVLSYSEVPSINGEEGVFIYLLDDRALVEHDDACLYEVDETVLEIDFGNLEEVTLVFELPDYAAGATVHVTQKGVLIESLRLEGGSFTYILAEDSELGFEISIPGMPAPTVPVVVTKPTTDDPEPV